MNYELMVIVPPLTPQEATARLVDLKAVVAKAGGTVDTAVSWGERTLAYRIEKHTTGVYLLLSLNLPQKNVAALTLALSLREDVLRSMIVVKPAPAGPVKETAKVVAAPATPLSVPATETKKTTDIELGI